MCKMRKQSAACKGNALYTNAVPKMRFCNDEGNVKMNRVEKTAVFSALLTAVIAAVKLLAGTMFGSIALVADAIHSFTDIIGSVAVFFGARFSGIKSEKFPFGLYKLENLVSLFLALLIFYTAFEIFLESFGALGSPGQSAGPITIAAALFSLIVSVFLARYKMKVGKEENSPSMVSEAKHTKTDAISTVGVLIAVTASFAGFPALDPIIGIAVAVLVFKAGLEIFLDSSKVLLDISLDYKTMRKIEQIASKQKDVKVMDIVARNSGSYVFVDLKLETGLKDLKRVSQVRQECEEKIRKAVPKIDKITIDVDYKRKDVLKYAVALESNSKEGPLAEEFGAARFFGIFTVDNKPGRRKVLSSNIIENPFCKSKERKGILAAEFLAKNKADVLFVKKEMHKGGAFYALQENFVEIKKTGKKSFKELLEGFE